MASTGKKPPLGRRRRPARRRCGRQSPPYCAAGRAIPRSPLPGCRWYVASQTCGVVVPLLPVPKLKEACCQQLRAVPADCRCKALTVMMEETPLAAVAGEGEGGGGSGGVSQSCLRAQAEFAATVVTEAECGLPTIHGRPFCHALSTEA